MRKIEKQLPEVKVGEVWKDNDPRVNIDRRCKVIEVKSRGRVVVEWLSGALRGKVRELKQERFNGSRTGYVKVSDGG